MEAPNALAGSGTGRAGGGGLGLAVDHRGRGARHAGDRDRAALGLLLPLETAAPPEDAAQTQDQESGDHAEQDEVDRKAFGAAHGVPINTCRP